MPVQGDLVVFRPVQEDGGWRLGLGGKGLRDDPRGGAVDVSRSGHLSGSLDLPGEGGHHGVLAGVGPGHFLGGAGEVAGGVLLLLEVGEWGAPGAELAVLVEGAVVLGVGGVPGGLAEGADVPPEHGADHPPGGVLHGVTLVLHLGFPVGETELAIDSLHGTRYLVTTRSTNLLKVRQDTVTLTSEEVMARESSISSELGSFNLTLLVPTGKLPVGK